jgi:hypothetical protein
LNPEAVSIDREYARQAAINDIGELVKQSAVSRASPKTANSQRRNSFGGGRLIPVTMGIHYLAWRLPAGEHGIDWAEQ